MPTPYCAWGWLRRSLPVAWVPAREEEEIMLVLWESLPDLEAATAAPPPMTMPGAPNEAAVGCFTGRENTVSCDSSASAAGLSMAVNILQGMLAALWVYMIYVMIRLAMDHYNEQGSGLSIMFLVLIAMIVTPYFGIAAQALDDVEAQSRRA